MSLAPSFEKAVLAIEASGNKKIGLVSATYAAQQSCPPDCALRNNGCYAEYGPMAIHTKRINNSNKTALEIAREEAEAILNMSGWLPLRLHVVGDCSTDETAKLVSHAAGAYSAKHNMPVWSYTHAWMEVNKSSWGKVSILASCENKTQVAEAHSKGYATALVDPKAAEGKVWEENGFTFIPCRQQVSDTDCRSCGLCFNAEKLHENKNVIAFVPHGAGKNKLLKVLNG